MDDYAAYWPILRTVLLVLLAGLPVMLGICLQQAVATRKAGDDALARSWTDAAKSFGSMTVMSWVLIWVVRVALLRGLEVISQLKVG